LISTNGTVVDGDKTFSNFSCTSTGNSGNACSTLDVQTLPGATVGLSFIGGLAATGATGLQDTLIGYRVTVNPLSTQSISQISLAFNGAITGATSLNDASVSVTETVRNSGNIVGNISVSAPVDLQDPPFEGLFDIPLTSTFKTLDVTKDIIIKTFKDGVAGTISFVDQDFEQTGTSVPEPTVLGLLGTGLVSLGAIIRRRRAA
jgi:hypothetical protein